MRKARPTSADVQITATGYQPTSVANQHGGSVHWTNASNQPHTVTPNGAPFGTGGNWGLKASTLPQAWNLAEALRRKASQVDVAVIDGGFVPGPAVPSLTVPPNSRPDAICGTTTDPATGELTTKCVQNATTLDHGNQVASIIQYGDQALRPGQLHGISSSGFAHSTNLLACQRNAPVFAMAMFDEVMELFNLALGEVRPGHGPEGYPQCVGSACPTQNDRIHRQLCAVHGTGR